MKFTLSALAILAAAVVATPTPPAHEVYLTFRGATNDINDRYEVTVPVNDKSVYIYNPLSISYITSYGPGNVKCVAYGIDGSKTVTIGTTTIQVGPPQTQTYVKCKYTD